MDSKNQGTTLPFLRFWEEVWGYSGTVLRYFTLFWYITLFSAILHYFMLFYSILPLFYAILFSFSLIFDS